MKIKNKTLVFVTTSYPFGKGEPLIEEEIKYLTTAYGKIHLISSDLVNSQTKFPEGNIQIQRFSNTLSFSEKIKGGGKLFSKHFLQEIHHYYLQKKKTPSIIVLKTIYNSLLIAKRFSLLLQNIIDNESNKQVDFYSYWCDEPVSGAAFIKNKNPNLHIYTRMHGYDLYTERHQINYLPFRKLIAEKCDKIFFISKQGSTYFQKLYQVADKKLRVIRLGVNNEFKAIPPPVSEKKILTIVSCSGIIELKRLNLIIDVLALVAQYHRVKWTHFGSGPLEQTIKTYAHNKLTNNCEVNFMGFTEQDEIMKYYALNRQDLFINLSETEGLPIAIMEVFSFGIPAIATNVGGVKEIVNDSNGYLVNVDATPEAIAQTIIQFWSLSNEEQQILRNNAQFTWDNGFNGEKNNQALIKEMLETQGI